MHIFFHMNKDILRIVKVKILTAASELLGSGVHYFCCLVFSIWYKTVL